MSTSVHTDEQSPGESLPELHDHAHSGPRLHAEQVGEDIPEPTVAPLEQSYSQELGRRFENLRGATRETLTGNDALGLRSNRGHGDTDRPPPATDLADSSASAAQRHEAFMQWFRDAVATALLGDTSDRLVDQGRHYTGRFVRSAYDRGLTYARHRLSEVGIDVDELDVTTAQTRPTHEEQLTAAYRRQVTLLNGAANAMESDASRVVLDELTGGATAGTLADRVTESIRTTQSRRGDATAATEPITVFSAAVATRYEDAGIRKAKVLTFPDACDRCKALADDNPYSIDQAKSILPEHPFCRCVVIPLQPASS